MLCRRTAALAKAALLLNKLKDRPEDLTLLLGLQEYLVARIQGVERSIKRYRVIRDAAKQRRKHSRLPRVESNLLKDTIQSAESRIDECQNLLFVWRCFGDGIANIYQSKYSLKHLYFSVENYSIKDTPGFITGKAGFDLEWKVLKHGIASGVPVLLCDLTNVLRHGDVCALAGADPLPIEIKSSRNRNARVDRQLQQLNELKDFFANDGADQFRGIPNVKRSALRLTEVTYVDQINSCIQRALSDGVSTADPEPGLRYIVIRESAVEKLPPLGTPSTLVTWLTPTPNWQTCYPFTLSFTPANLLSFIQGRAVIFVLVDMAVVRSLFKKHGIHATMLMDGISAVQICPDPTDLSKGVFRISESLFQRISLEFQSLEWFAAEHSLIFASAPRAVSESELASLKGIGKIPEDWQNAKDCFDAESNSDELLIKPKPE